MPECSSSSALQPEVKKEDGMSAACSTPGCDPVFAKVWRTAGLYKAEVSGQVLHFHVIRLPWNKFFEQADSTA